MTVSFPVSSENCLYILLQEAGIHKATIARQYVWDEIVSLDKNRKSSDLTFALLNIGCVWKQLDLLCNETFRTFVLVNLSPEGSVP